VEYALLTPREFVARVCKLYDVSGYNPVSILLVVEFHCEFGFEIVIVVGSPGTL
jgi:hypothetical protein